MVFLGCHYRMSSVIEGFPIIFVLSLEHDINLHKNKKIFICDVLSYKLHLVVRMFVISPGSLISESFYPEFDN